MLQAGAEGRCCRQVLKEGAAGRCYSEVLQGGAEGRCCREGRREVDTCPWEETRPINLRNGLGQMCRNLTKNNDQWKIPNILVKGTGQISWSSERAKYPGEDILWMGNGHVFW